ncbi:MAG: DUF4388 domain-containing protein [bacterium]
MPIEGDLKSLNLSSVMQLISQENLTGVLKIKRRNEVVDIGFSTGQVTGAFYEKGEKSERMEKYLVRSGIIGKNVYELVEEIHSETKRPVMNIILEDKYVTRTQVESLIKFKIQEVVDEIFTWNDGAFKFEQNSIIYPKSMIRIRMNTEGLILEAARRFDEWSKISKSITSGDIVFKKVERPELKLKPSAEEERVLSLLNGHRSVDDMIEISGLGKFRTYSFLYRLLSTGQIEMAYAKPTPKKMRQKKVFSIKFLRMPITIAIAAVMLILEFIIGNYFASNKTVAIDLVNDDFYVTDHEHYRMIFFYKHNRMPAVNEVIEIFEK